MGTRLELQSSLESLLGTSNVYFQPPASISMNYPAIVYHRDDVDTQYADNNPYSQTKRYQVTVIDKDPDSLIPDKVGMLRMCSFSRQFKADNLNHDIFNLYF